MPSRLPRTTGPAGANAAYHAVDRLTLEVALLFFRMRAVATGYLGQGRHSTGRRSILKSLAEGPRTVPDMARERSVSRQHVQTLVDALHGDGLVDTRVNPADRRSRLVRLTAKGRAFLEELRVREVKLFADLAAGIPPRELERATRLLREMRGRLEKGRSGRDPTMASRLRRPRRPPESSGP